MTPRKQEDRKEGILELMLRSLRAIGTSVEEILDKMEGCYNKAERNYNSEWSMKDLYNNGDY